MVRRWITALDCLGERACDFRIPQIARWPPDFGRVARQVNFSTAVRREEWRRGTQMCVRYAWREHSSKTLGLGWTSAKWGGPPGPRPTPTSACCWYSSMLEVAGPGGPARTRGSAPPLVEVFIPLDGLQAHVTLPAGRGSATFMSRSPGLRLRIIGMERDPLDRNQFHRGPCASQGS